MLCLKIVCEEDRASDGKQTCRSPSHILKGRQNGQRTATMPAQSCGSQSPPPFQAKLDSYRIIAIPPPRPTEKVAYAFGSMPIRFTMDILDAESVSQGKEVINGPEIYLSELNRAFFRSTVRKG